MSLFNSYRSPRRASARKRRYRKAYTGSKAISKGCRNSGNCEYCRSNRTHHNRRREPLVTLEELAWPASA